MLFPTMTFGLFFLVVYVVAWSLDRENERRKLFLLLASWCFYAGWDWRFVGLLIASAVLNWAVAAGIGRTENRAKRKWLVALGVLINLTILGFFKYYGFFAEQAAELLTQAGWARDIPLMQVILPVGVSFFTFQGISYIVDVHRRVCPPARSLLDVMLLLSFFPHLVAGPIVRAADLLPQFARVPTLTREAAAHGLLLIGWGLFKKTVIASELATGLVDPVFFDPTAHNAADLLAAVYGYAVQIYCDFSAYSDIAIGVAALLGYRFPRNFDQPYRARSLQDFWRRWHISLSSWLRDYLYIPLGGGRKGTVAASINIMVTMLLGGLWHGAAWTFVAWGALHGGVQVIERVWRRAKPVSWPMWPALIGVLITFHVVCLGWVLFRAETFTAALQVLEGLARWSGPVVLTPLLAGLIAVGLAMHWLPPRGIEGLARGAARLPSPAVGATVGLVFLLVEAVRPEGVAPFIYFQF
ncbi:MAG TPA: MBOAT family protein [Caulobacteraceae bacterium]|jgi:D-alanyl-lipoteichoic acid acyltransferase DltB (MBOAT superfamily)